MASIGAGINAPCWHSEGQLQGGQRAPEMILPLHVEGLHGCSWLSVDRLQVMRGKGSLDVVRRSR